MFKEIDKNGVLYLVSDKLKAPHGFSTRIGGRSTNPDTASMNFGSSAEDTFVGENIKIFTDSAGLCNKTVRARQIHSTEIVRFFDKGEFENIDGEGFYNTGCDGFITDLSGVSLCVRTADCLPIIMTSGDGKTVAALHAGWRGSVSQIARRAVEIFRERGIESGDIFAALGPCISKCCFEVGNDFVEEFSRSLSAHLLNRVVEKRNGKIYCDIKKLNYLILTEAGVPDENIDISEYCTCHTPELFFSHRRTGVKRGTMGAVCMIKED